jgi:myo-inositol 2-dehydrogenase / D-chiro-inositol 1-dehydrogenase
MTGAELALKDPVKAIDHPSVDAVVIVTPTDTHAHLIEVAANAGKAVFSEKPIALDLAETQRVVQVVRERKVAAQLGLIVDTIPAMRKAKAKIDAARFENGYLLQLEAIFRGFMRGGALPLPVPKMH